MPPFLHIVSFNVPFPADYGGVIDVYHRIVALHKLGVHIHLHTFTYGRQPAPELQQHCDQVTYYQRRTGPVSALSTRPYIVQSRDSSQLLSNLQKDNAPILLEGLHCCSLLEHIQHRTVIVRAHNVEHEYYARLAAAERNPLLRLYYSSEARRLQRYEPILKRASAVLAVTEADAAHFRSIGCHNVILMPTSHSYDCVVSQPAPVPSPDNAYVLYHADLSVPENIDAVQHLIHNILPHIDVKFTIAGRNPSPKLTSALAHFNNVSLVANPDDTTMQQLIQNAHILFLFTNSPTGLKLKLLNSLYAGRHCLVNSTMVAGTELGQLCTVADTDEQQLCELDRLMHTPFTQHDIDQRSNLLGNLYSNQANAQKLISLCSDIGAPLL